MNRSVSGFCATLLCATAAFSGTAHAAGFNCGKFSRNDDGSWRAIEPVEIFGPQGRIDFTPDETYTEGQKKQGLDIAKLLNANCIRK